MTDDSTGTQAPWTRPGAYRCIGQPDLSIDINHNGSGSLDASAVIGADGSLSLTIPSIAVDSDRITAAKNDLSGSLTSIGDTVSGLSSNTNNNLQALINDIRAITAQMNKIGQTLSGASQNVTTDTDDLINDVSDELHQRGQCQRRHQRRRHHRCHGARERPGPRG